MNTIKPSKITILTLLVVLGTLFTSCSKDDKEDEAKEPSIVGTWLETSYEEDEYINGTLTDSGIESFTLEYATTLTFKSDNTYLLSYTEDDQVIIDKGAYSINGNKLSFIVDGETLIADFSVNVNELTLIFEYTEIEDGIQIRYVDTYKYSRQ